MIWKFDGASRDDINVGGNTKQENISLNCTLERLEFDIVKNNEGDKKLEQQQPRELAAQFILPNTLISNLSLEIKQEIPTNVNDHWHGESSMNSPQNSLIFNVCGVRKTSMSGRYFIYPDLGIQ